METNNDNLNDQFQQLTLEEYICLKQELQASRAKTQEKVGIIEDLKQKRIEEMKWSFNRIEELKPRKPVQDSQEGQVQQLTTQLRKAESKIDTLEKRERNLDSEKKALEIEVEQLKKQLKINKTMKKKAFVKQLQREGKLCDKNCVRLALHWICKNKLKSPCCSEQLGSIIIGYAIGNRKIEKSDMQCNLFMGVLSSCGIVDHSEPLCANEIEEAWSKLESTKEGVYILATMIPSRTGHAVVCDLHDGKIMFHDPAAPSPSEQSREMSQEDFTEYVEGSEDIGLFTVNLKELDKVVNYHKDVLHNPCETHQIFGTAPEEE